MNAPLRPEVEAALDRFSRELPKLIAETPSERLMDEIASRIEAISGEEPADVSRIHERVSAMLCSEGLVPGEECDAAEDAG